MGNYYLSGGSIATAAGSGQSVISASLGINGSESTVNNAGITRFTINSGSSLLVSGVVSLVHLLSWGGIDKYGDGTLTLTNGGNGYAEGMTIYGGTVEFAARTRCPRPTPPPRCSRPTRPISSRTPRSAGCPETPTTYRQRQSAIQQIKIADGVTATFDTNGNDVTLGTAFALGSDSTAAVTKTGAGTLTLTAANGYSGGTTIAPLGGVLQLGNSAALGTGGLTVNGGTWTWPATARPWPASAAWLARSATEWPPRDDSLAGHGDDFRRHHPGRFQHADAGPRAAGHADPQRQQRLHRRHGGERRHADRDHEYRPTRRDELDRRRGRDVHFRSFHGRFAGGRFRRGNGSARAGHAGAAGGWAGRGNGRSGGKK